MNSKLIVYFSHKGENYSKGKIVNLMKGNTEKAAEIISKLSGAKLFEIKAEKDYPNKYDDCIEVAKKELKENSRPKLVNDIDITEYDTIFIAFPNWWGTMPMPVFTFLEGKDFSNKTIFPLCTHEGSGLGRSEVDIKRFVNGANVLKGLAIVGSEVDTAEKAISEWINKNI